MYINIFKIVNKLYFIFYELLKNQQISDVLEIFHMLSNREQQVFEREDSKNDGYIFSISEFLEK